MNHQNSAIKADHTQLRPWLLDLPLPPRHAKTFTMPQKLISPLKHVSQHSFVWCPHRPKPFQVSRPFPRPLTPRPTGAQRKAQPVLFAVAAFRPEVLMHYDLFHRASCRLNGTAPVRFLVKFQLLGRSRPPGYVDRADGIHSLDLDETTDTIPCAS